MSDVVQINYVEGDNLENIFVTYKGDISSFVSINLDVRRPNGTSLTKPAIIDNAPEGKFHFEWATGDLIAGINEARIKLEVTAGNVKSVPDVPLRLNVRSIV